MTMERLFKKNDCILTACQRQFRLLFLTVCFIMVFDGNGVVTVANPVYANPAPITLTNALQVRHIAKSLKGTLNYTVRLMGIILWISSTRDQLILQDDSGGVIVNMDLREQMSVRPGQQVLIEGRCLIERGRIISEMMINNDGIHSSLDKSIELFLSAGLHPISVEWFNGPADFELEVDWRGPGTPRQQVPNDALFRAELNQVGGTNQLVHGLDYRCYEGAWNWLPDFSQLPVLKTGVVANFDLKVRTRDTDVGLVFTGYLRVPQTGIYTLWTKSDDGSKLYLNDQLLRLDILGLKPLPVPHRISPGEPIPEEQEYQWAEVEGTVTSVNEFPDEVSVEVTSDNGHTYLKIMKENDNALSSLKALLHSRIKAKGICQTTYTVDGQTIPSLLVPGLNQIAISEVASSHWADFPIQPIHSWIETNISVAIGTIIHINGMVCSNSLGEFPVIEDNSGRILLKTSQTPPKIGDQVEAFGWWSLEGSNVILRNGFYKNVSLQINHNANGLPLLTKAIQVINLSRKEAQRGYPVRIQGVITARTGNNFFIQDSTWSVYVTWNISAATQIPKIGDYWEIEGNSDVDFAPDVKANDATYLGPGNLPEPIRPAWDELVNGSLATKYIEIQGIAAIIETNYLTLLTREGKIRLQLPGLKELDKKFEGALIRIRGVASPDRDTNQMILSNLRILNASVSVDQLAPPDPFETPLKRTSDLLLFDARAGALQRVRIAGQILYGHNGEYFLMDGANGLRFDPKFPLKLQAGELVQVVGFPEMAGPSPVLYEALVRVTGKADLPPARLLSEDTLLNGKLDATLVCIQARFIGLGLNADNSEEMLELQTGTRSYMARLAINHGIQPDLLPGSLLELTGVYAGQGGNRAQNRDIDSFELLLNSSSDIRVLARPSWWTYRHTFTVIGGMMLIILIALVWITLLHRQVEERTLQLTSEIKSREEAERRRILEAERVRIAQDLHDELGATLTEIRFLSAVKGRDLLVPQVTRSQLMVVSEKARQMVSSLDEIVWAVNPANDSLPSLANYFCHLTGEFFRTTEVRCRLDVDEALPPITLTSEVRHNLYLVVRESLNNIAKHSKATEAWLRIHWKDQGLDIVIEDNGCGFNRTTIISGNGLINMRRRLDKIGGRFECNTRRDSGTVCRIYLPFA